jgi:hypothetical protein
VQATSIQSIGEWYSTCNDESGKNLLRHDKSLHVWTHVIASRCPIKRSTRLLFSR